MKLMGVSNRRRAVSPVISAVILSAAVIVVGGVVWFFSQGAMAVTAEDYVEGVVKMTETISERFIIEHVSYNGTFYIWVYNYGDVDIEVKVQVGDVTMPEGIDDWSGVESGGLKLFKITDPSPVPGEGFDIKAFSRRGNNVYYRYLVPQA